MLQWRDRVGISPIFPIKYIENVHQYQDIQLNRLILALEKTSVNTPLWKLSKKFEFGKRINRYMK